jgi:A/G-specific adenine glycosylase
MNFSTDTLNLIRDNLLVWGNEHMREFPWRVTRDPYAVLIAEVLLHRTKALQVLPIYVKVIERYPSVEELAKAPIEELDVLLRPLGLRWRIPLLKSMAEKLVTDFAGNIPSAAKPLMELPGVGPYISSATICFSFNIPEIILDTNTVRVIGRLTDTPISDSSRRSKKFQLMMWTLLDHQRPKLFNLALLDLAALVCLPSVPHCNICPLSEMCYFGKRTGTDLLP